MGAVGQRMPPREVAPAAAWALRGRLLAFDRPRIMGVVNLTPDSFYDGGKLIADDVDTPNVSVAARRCEQLVGWGADVLDLGGESTRPGATPVPPDRELARVRPVIERLVALGITAPISIDTRHAEVAAGAITAGAAIVNDISGLADPAMADVVAAAEAGLVIGHLRGEPATMQHEVRFVDVVREVADELALAVERAMPAGIARERIVVDPGIGFGKAPEHSAALMAASCELQAATGCPVLVGASRKSFLATLIGDPKADRLAASIAAAVLAVERGAAIVRVHDVQQTAHALQVAYAIDRAWRGGHPR
ncbi:MAG TPA: dihydropteroate synthase [Nannocystaceae bacterium]|nr:dihydropteroate synthase [Nannocystaceae bacterium]